MKRIFVCFFILQVLMSACVNRSTPNRTYTYISYSNDNKGRKVENRHEIIEVVDDSTAIVTAFERYFISLKTMYEMGRMLGDTLKVPSPDITFEIKDSFGRNIRNDTFPHRNVILANLYEEIVFPSKVSYLNEVKAKKDKLEKSVRLTNYYLSSPNSASGVDAHVYYKNLSDKTIKYFYWEGYPINAVGDQVNCDIRGNKVFRGKDTGPIKKGQSGGGCWECAWYNWTAKKLIITSVEVEYMDGSSIHISGDDLYEIGKKK